MPGTLHEAARAGDLSLLERLVAEGADIQATDHLGRTALHLAAARGHRRVVERLIELGAQVDARDNDARTPLHHAAARHHVPVVRVLLAHGATPGALDAKGNRPIDLARIVPEAPSGPVRGPRPGHVGGSGRTSSVRGFGFLGAPGQSSVTVVERLLARATERAAGDGSFDTGFAEEARCLTCDMEEPDRAAPEPPPPAAPPLQTSSTRKVTRPEPPPAEDKLAQARATDRGVFGLIERWRRDKVDCTVFAPPAVPSGDQFLVQVFAHLPRHVAEAAAAAREFNGDAERRGTTSLGTRIRRGSTLTFELHIPPLEIDAPVRELAWRGALASIEFGVSVPRGTREGTLVGAVFVSQDRVPVGEVRFKVTVAGRVGAASGAGALTGEARRYQQAFISYASQDRDRVLDRVAMLPAVGIRYFQDVFDLEPGEQWLPRIHDWIDRSDVFLLFWSRNAKSSAWVEKEWRYALERKGDTFIRPVPIEGPPIPEPPPELAHLHFADRALYFARQTG